MTVKLVSTAKVVDGVLILSLPDAVSPVVWQMELGQSKSSALEVRTSTDGLFVLTLKTPRQDVLEIASYNQKDPAIKALLATSQAMEKAQGQLKSAASQAGHYPVPVLSQSNDNVIIKVTKKVLSWFFLTLLALVSLFVIGTLLIFAANALLGGGNNTPSSSSAPVSAEEFFENR